MTWPQAQLPAVPAQCIKSEGPLFHTAEAELPDVDKSNGAHVPLQEPFGIGAKILCVASFEKAGRERSLCLGVMFRVLTSEQLLCPLHCTGSNSSSTINPLVVRGVVF